MRDLMDDRERLRALERASHRRTGMLSMMAAAAIPPVYLVLSLMMFQDPLELRRLLIAAGATLLAFGVGRWQLRKARDLGP